MSDELAPLLARLRAGLETEASAVRLDALLRPRLGRYFGALGAGATESEELVQKTLVRVFQSVRELREPESFLPWLFVVARNVARSAAARRRPETSLGSPGSDALAEPRDPGPSPADRAEAREQLAVARTAIAALPPQQRQCLLLRLREEASYEEIAATLRLSPRTVRNHLAAARRTLRRAVGERDGLEETT